ncbi:MAG: polyprenyl diphosphate synthase [Hadesarchaea archaeon]|nr:polyprenyl diphosphate synthase [Hadesarchaea archaeon]
MILDRLYRLAARYYEKRLLEEVKRGEMPKHVAIILDGNRRFARKAGMDERQSYLLGAEKLEEVLSWCQELGIRYGTVYAFSTENFHRSKQEVDALMDLFAEKFRQISRDERVHRNRIRVRVIGDLSRLPERVVAAIREAEEATRGYDGYFLTIALSYGGRAEIVDAVRRICERVRRGELSPEEVNEQTIGEHLYTAGSPDPDLIIRTSGEERLSGFLLWQSAYSELYFCEAYWPEFSKIDFLRAIRTFQKRERRFGR